MNNIHDIIISILEKKDRNLTWLSQKIGYSRQGLRAALKNDTVKLETFLKIEEALEMNRFDLFSLVFEKPVIRFDEKALIKHLDNLENNGNEIIELKRIIQDKQKIIDNYEKELKNNKAYLKLLFTHILKTEGLSYNDLANYKDSSEIVAPKLDIEFKDASLKDLTFLSFINHIINE